MNMENKTDAAANEVLGIENRLFWFRILIPSIGYLGMTLLLNSIRSSAWLWFVWVLIIIQFALYLSIFVAGYKRSKVFGLNKNLAIVLFTILALGGRVNDWELVIIPLLVVIMLVFSVKNKKILKMEN